MSHLLTIIVPHFDSSALLAKLLSTIPEDARIQVVVVNDHSSAREWAALRRLPVRGNVTVLTNEGPKGVGAARNLGIRHARGRWILFADADDYFLPGWFERIQPDLDSPADAIFYTPTSVYLDTGQPADRHQYPQKLIDHYLDHSSAANTHRLQFMSYAPWSKLVKTALIQGNGLAFDDLPASEDVMFSIRLGHCIRSFEVRTEPIYAVTRSPGTLTTNLSEPMFDTRVTALARALAFMHDQRPGVLVDALGHEALALVYEAWHWFGWAKARQVYRSLRRERARILCWKALNPYVVLRGVLRVYGRRAYGRRIR